MKPLVIVYGLFALAAFLSAAYFGVPYWTSPGASLSEFIVLAYTNGPAATLSADVTVLYPLASLWILIEGRRQKMRFVWLYLVANTCVAVAFGLSLFLLVRELKRARLEHKADDGL
jgi:hypothetical protein